MPNRVNWEWNIVTWYDDEDIKDNEFSDSLDDFCQEDLKEAVIGGLNDDCLPITLEVVRWEVDKHGYTQDRCTARVVGGVLDDETCGGYRVPMKVKKELKKKLKSMRG